MTTKNLKVPAVTFDGVYFDYGDKPVISNASFTIETGAFIGVIGPNGGGKSTLLKLMMGFLKPVAGSIRLFDHKPSDAFCQLAYVPQGGSYDKKFPICVEELVLLGLLSKLPWHGRFRKEEVAAAQAAMERMGIGHLSRRSVGTLSGGQLQRALIARALVSKPKLLLLDEPTANVDADAEKEIYATLQALAGETTIVMVTHDLKTSIDLVDWVLCVQEKVTAFAAAEVCEHFALGLYHAPLLAEQSSCCLQVTKKEEK